MELYQNLCKNCGGDLHATGDGKFKCAFCGSVFEEKVVVDYADEMRKLFDEFKLEAISNARKNLYSAVTAEYISSQQVHEWCMALKQYLPDDFQANFYETAIGANGRKTAKAIRKINVKENAEYIETIIKFLIVSLKPEFISEVCDLIERAYKLTDLVKFREYSTKLSVEAEKLDNCIYLTNYPRDVFVAYSSRDMEKVLELVECLEEQGLLCFIAARNLRHGAGAVENYEKALREAMDNCQSFVFVSSTSSRNPGCDALRQEIPYIKSSDIENAPHELRNNYANIPQKYKKHRVEYRIEESPRPMAADRIVSDFFSGYERVYTPMDVAERVLDIPTAIEEEAPTSQPIPPASVKYCITCLNECPEDAKFCMNCGGNTFANTPNEAKLMQQIAALQNADKERIARESAEREAAERARREEELARRERELAERARREEELARRERELAEKEQREAEERARREREAAERAKHDAEERAKRELEEKARREAAILAANVKIGDVVKFGKYQQSGSDSAKEDVEWIVLDKKDGRALVISKYVLDCQKYNETQTSVTWETCTLRKWLNDEFFTSAFSAAERSQIPTVSVSTDAKSSSSTSNAKITTQDNVFLLSIPEIEKYFSANSSRACLPTAYAISRGAEMFSRDSSCLWWLRSPGCWQNAAAIVRESSGSIDYGRFVNFNYPVRPAIWVDLSAPIHVVSESEKRESEDKKRREREEIRKLEAEKAARLEREIVERATVSIPKSVKVGDILKFGRYAQESISTTKKEDIEWQVLEVKDGRALLISKYGLDCQKYNEVSKSITWEACTLRKWLNNDFINSAFIDIERQKILTVTVPADKNPSYGTNPGNATQDKVFLLSVPEAKKYFDNGESLLCEPTAYAFDRGAVKGIGSKYCSWWLRSPGNVEYTAAVVCHEKSFAKEIVDKGHTALRPALWIEFDPLAEEKAKREAEERAKREAEEKARLEREAEEKARLEREAAERARRERESKKTDQPVRVGDVVRFGKYKQSTRLFAGKTDIEWIVLDVENGRSLLISKYGLDCQQFNASGNPTTWERCSLRRWLNGEFLSNAFSKTEIAKIKTSKVQAHKTPNSIIDPGKPTQDMVFLLSFQEATKYFYPKETLVCKPTDYAISCGIYVDKSNGACRWLLRSPGYQSKFATFVNCDGQIDDFGVVVDNYDHTIRPAMWVDLRP